MHCAFSRFRHGTSSVHSRARVDSALELKINKIVVRATASVPCITYNDSNQVTVTVYFLDFTTPRDSGSSDYFPLSARKVRRQARDQLICTYDTRTT
ncbi:hypothetical protein [Pseudonocardia spinosispora]|uniref:hypothetical protein n=1 Tax=Pseudonocardia spinosispora TaxID=103441 RepID=UPI0004912F58|nr:hypothetical protein [Pseudonocardia spinosispora]